MTTVIICNGILGDYDYARSVVQQSDFIICADGGMYHAAKLGITPDVLIGDMDSYKLSCSNHTSRTKVIKYPPQKDQTDTELCIRYAMEIKSDQVILLGALGGRLDHMLANIFLLRLLLDNQIKGSILDAQTQLYLAGPGNAVDISGEIGQTVSLIPLDHQVQGVSCTGLQYSLQGDTLLMSVPRGISNVFVDRHARVTVEKGVLAVVKCMEK